MKPMKFSNLIFLVTLSFVFIFTEVFCEPQHYRTSYQYCASAQTFFKGQCRPIGSTEHCPVNMQLFDGPNKEGFCHCDNYSYPAFYSGTAYCFRLDNESSYETFAYPAPAPAAAGLSSIKFQAPCRPGTVRGRSGYCSIPIYG